MAGQKERDLDRGLLGECEFSRVGARERTLYFPLQMSEVMMWQWGQGGRENERWGRPKLWDQVICPPIPFFLEA